MRRAVVVSLVVLLLVGAGAAGWWWFSRVPDPGVAAERFAAGLAEQAVDPSLLVDPGLAESATALVAGTGERLGGAPRVTLGEIETAEDGRASAPAEVTWPLPSGDWTYPTNVPLVLTDGQWGVAWSPAVLHPQLGPDQTLEVRTTLAPRASILAADSRPLFEPRPVVTVGVQPGRVEDLDEVLGVLSAEVGVDPEPLRERVLTAGPDAFVDVVTLRREEYEPLRPFLRPVPGIVLSEGERQLAPSRTFARALLGRVGPATQEVLEEAGPNVPAGAELGLSGLQRQFQRELTGTPGVQVVAAGPDGQTGPPLHEVPAVPGRPLRTTLVPEVQIAAETALAGLPTPSSLVAIRPSTGEVLAVANGPDGGAANLAMTGQYPPGSTFKVVSTAALLTAGLATDQPVDCPPTVTVEGRGFRNAEGGAAGRVSFADAFAESCNTTIIPLSLGLSAGAVADAAAGFGIPGDHDLGVGAYSGQVPPAIDQVERAAETIGQGRVLASPLAMAAVAGAVGDGTWRPPVLLIDVADPGSGPRPLDPAVATALRTLMRRVVTDGTGSALAGLPGEPAGKTGTAEYGDEVPPRTHAWFIGYRGDLAFAVLLEDGGTGSRDAAPVAAGFLTALG